jgi:hypothetical protein
VGQRVHSRIEGFGAVRQIGQFGKPFRVDNFSDAESKLDECLVSYQQLVDNFGLGLNA